MLCPLLLLLCIHMRPRGGDLGQGGEVKGGKRYVIPITVENFLHAH